MSIFDTVRQNITVDILPRYPLGVSAGAGLTASKTNGILNVGLNIPALVEDETPDGGAFVLIHDGTTHKKAQIDNFPIVAADRSLGPVKLTLIPPLIVSVATALDATVENKPVVVTGSGGITVTLPNTSVGTGFATKIINRSSGIVTVASVSGQTVNGAASIALDPLEYSDLVVSASGAWIATIGYPELNVGALSEETSPVGSDFVLLYDGTTHKKLQISNLPTSSDYETVADLEAATIGGSIDSVRVLGVTAAGNEAILSRRGSTPSPVEAWHVQSDDGAYWEVEQVNDLGKWLVDSGVDSGDIQAAVGRYLSAKGVNNYGVTDARPGLYDYPLPLFQNGDFSQWTTRGSYRDNYFVETAGSGAGFTNGTIADGWYGGPGISGKYRFSTPVKDAATNKKWARFQWTVAVTDGEIHHAPTKRFSFLERNAQLQPEFVAGQEVTIEFTARIASGTATITPIGYLSMGNPAWAASTAYSAGDYRSNDSAGGEFGYARIYLCTTAGTSASSGGPTGTGSAITDGTVTWQYVGESKGREFELYEASGTENTVRVARGASGPSAAVTITETEQRFRKTIFIPYLNYANTVTYAGQTHDNVSRVLTPPGGGAFFGIAFDLTFSTASSGPDIYLADVDLYVGRKPLARIPKVPNRLAQLLANSEALLNQIHINRTIVLGARNTPFAKAHVSISGTTPTLDDGYGATVTYGGSTGRWDVVFNVPAANEYYHAAINVQTPNSADATAFINWNTGIRTVNGFQIYFTSGANPETFVNPPAFSFCVLR